jgi:thiol-disulfide isomerase/thioredoxin
MKKLLFIAVLAVFIGCNESVKNDYAIISGKITNKLAGEVSLNSFDRTFTETLDIAGDGTFTDTVSTDISSYVIYDGKNPIFLHLEPGTNLNITYDAQDFENSLSISGTNSDVSNYLMAKRKNERELFGNPAETYVLNEIDFKTKLKNIQKHQDSLLESFENISNEFKLKEKRNLQYTYLNYLSDYEPAYRHFSKTQDFKVSEDFLSELNDIKFDSEEDYAFSMYYKSLVNNNFREKATKLVKSDSIDNDIAFLKVVSSVENESLKNDILFDFANQSMGYSNNVDAFYELYKTLSTNKKNNDIITEKYNKLTAVAVGRPSPKFINFENYAGGTTSLDDLKGKYVYIDVWATWCGPCKREIPFLKEVEEKYHGKNIEFVSISIDKASDHDKWKAMVNDKSLGGMQLFADNDWKSSFVTDYQIQGIPRFILIDDKGNIVDPNAPRPSSPALINLLSTLNI